jgi:hypothetical protein
MAATPIPLGALTLDSVNPRHEPTHSTAEAIAALLADESDARELLTLAEDIIVWGTSPADLPIVFKDSHGTWVVVEGNRRIAAMKLLANPELAAGHPAQRRFKELAKALGERPETIDCAVVPTREAARHWIELRHTGKRGGAGIVPWDAEMRHRFEESQGTQVARALAFIEAVSSEFSSDAQLLRYMETVRTQKPTTLGRLVSDPEIRAVLGFRLVDGRVVWDKAPAAVKAAIKQLFADLAEKLTVSDVKSKKLRGAYATKLSTKVVASTSAAGRRAEASSSTDGRAAASGRSNSARTGRDSQPTGTDGSATSETEAEAEAPEDTAGGSRRQRPKAATKLFQGVVFKHLDLRVSDMLKEAQRLDIDAFPNIAAAMIRVILDLAVTDAAAKFGWTRENNEFKDRVRAVIKKIDPQRQDPELLAVWAGIEGQGILAPKTMHGYLHEPSFKPTTTEVRRISANYTPFLKRLDEFVGSKI